MEKLSPRYWLGWCCPLLVMLVNVGTRVYGGACVDSDGGYIVLIFFVLAASICHEDR